MRWWKESLGHLKLSDITSEKVAEHRGKLEREPFTVVRRGKAADGTKPKEYPRSPSTVRKYLTNLSAVLTVARKEWRWLDADPFDNLTMPSEGKGRIRFLTEDERAALLTETVKDPQLHLLVVLALATSSRAGELLKLTWRDVELQEGLGFLWDTKNDESRAIWLHGEARRLLDEHHKRQGGGLDDLVFVREGGEPYQYRYYFEKACERAGVKDFPFHCLRHSAATYLARMGASEQQLKAFGGWKSNVVSRYVHMTAKDTRELQERMNNKLFGSSSDEGKDTQ